MDESLQIDEHGAAERMYYRYAGYVMSYLERAMGFPASTYTTFSEIYQAAIHTAALLEDAERSKLVLCRECRYWGEYGARDFGCCIPPGPTKKEPWPGKPHHDTMDCAGDFGCVCGVRR